MADASFEDGAARPVALKAETAEDVTVLSALLQDAVLTMADVSWLPRKRRLALLVNRVRREDSADQRGDTRPPERTRSLLQIDSVLSVRAQGVRPEDRDLVSAILSLTWEEDTPPSGSLTFILAGDGAIAVQVECLDMTLTDVTRPYRAVSGKLPDHRLDD